VIEPLHVEAADVAPSQRPEDKARSGAMDAYRLLKVGLFGLRAGPALILTILVVVVSLTTPIFFTPRNLGNVLSQTAVIAVLALGQLLVIVTRGIDLSVGATLALSTVCGALVFNHISGNGLLVILVILGTGLGVGLVNGAVFVWGRIPHPFIVTLATFSIARGIALWAANGTLIPGMPHSVQVLGGSSVHSVPYSAFLVGGIALAVIVLTTFLVWGRWLYAVGGNPEAARRTGVPVNRVLISVYALSGLAAGVGGLITAGQTASGSPTFAEGIELDAIAAVIIGGAAFAGGRGHVGNALVGAFTIGVIRNALNLQAVNAFFQLMVIGVVVLLAVESDVVRGKLEERFRVARATREA
jgi:ribose transport system permease protein